MTQAEQLAAFVGNARIERLPEATLQQLRIRLLDSLGCALGALTADPIRAVYKHLQELGGNPLCTLIGGGTSAPDRAAFFNGALVRYLDFMDSYLAPGETCHPSDNLAPVLAAAEHTDATGAELLTALAVAYQVHTRLSDVAPVRHKGFDHTTQGAYAVAAGVAKALRLSPAETVNAIAISGTCNVALRVTRTGSLSHWKGLAYPNTAFVGTHAAYLAKHGITGPKEVFEGTKGFQDSISGPFVMAWQEEPLDSVHRTIIKKFNAEIHSQSAIDGALDLRRQHGFSGNDVAGVEIAIFDVAYNIIGGGEEGNKTSIKTKEEADHSLPYMVAVALLDGELLPAQYTPERIAREDVQSLLRQVTVRPEARYTAKFPEQLGCWIAIDLKDGRRFETERRDYEGFHTNPMSWGTVYEKFGRLASPFASQSVLDDIVESVSTIERLKVRALTERLQQVQA